MPLLALAGAVKQFASRHVPFSEERANPDKRHRSRWFDGNHVGFVWIPVVEWAGKLLLIDVMGEMDPRHRELTQVARTHCPSRNLLRLRQCRQENGRQHGYDGDHHQQFDEGEGASFHGFVSFGAE